jgi:protein-disulfide isomerase
MIDSRMDSEDRRPSACGKQAADPDLLARISNRLRHIAILLATCLTALVTAASAQTASTPTAPPVKLSKLSLAGIPQHNETLGSLRAPVKILYFDDPQCPVCLAWHRQVLPVLVRKYVRTGRLQIQWHGFAVIGPDSVTGERFVAAAGLQDHLWDVLDDIEANQGEGNSGWLTASLFERIGASIPGFDVTAALAAANSPTVTHELAADLQQGEVDGIPGVPYMRLGRRGGHLVWAEDALPPLEKAINHLLRDTWGR